MPFFPSLSNMRLLMGMLRSVTAPVCLVKIHVDLINHKLLFIDVRYLRLLWTHLDLGLLQEVMILRYSTQIYNARYIFILL